MSTERHDEPAILHALESVQDALRTEERAQEPLSRENVRLRARIEQLQAERDSLLRAVEGPGATPSSRKPRLPEALVPPFKVHAGDVPLPKALRWWLPAPVMVLLMLAVGWNQDPLARLFNFVLLLLVLGVQATMFWLRRWWGLWRFDTDGFEGGGRQEGTQGRVWYSNVREVEVYISASQRRRGVGTLVVRYLAESWSKTTYCVLLKDVPEPERLAAWLREKRSGPA